MEQFDLAVHGHLNTAKSSADHASNSATDHPIKGDVAAPQKPQKALAKEPVQWEKPQNRKRDVPGDSPPDFAFAFE